MPLGDKGCIPPQSSLEDAQGAEVLVRLLSQLSEIMTSKIFCRVIFTFSLFFHCVFSQLIPEVVHCSLEMNTYSLPNHHADKMISCTDADELTYACVQSKCNKGNQARFKNCTIPGSTKSLTRQIITPLVFTAFTQCDQIHVASGIDSSGKQISNARCEPSSNPAPGSRPTCGECYVASFATLIRAHCDEQLRRL
ncbi:hypothetical protein O181_111249 [Austropuccinia psidii MF-1]|uniref:Uncharacterized protein n=1 Tax=Austropuccinia psidii MF-1 TaxID=1389203 RepID=A0A9Q3PRM0_9BASI|nr:hypothetical protein [Austropuccinia psidii MF-1]